MRGKIVNNHSRRGNIIHQTQIINQLISENKINQAKMMINELIKDYPDDNVLLYSMVRILSFEGKYKEAYQLILQLTDQEEVYNYFFVVLAILNHDLERMEYYYYKYYANGLPSSLCKDIDKMTLKIYLQKIFEPNKPVVLDGIQNQGKGSYYIRQIANYNPQAAYQHIIDNHVAARHNNKTKFNSDIDLKYLTSEIKKLIEENQGNSYLVNLKETYYFYYPNCGKKDNDSDYNLNYLVASTIFNTSDILTIYPCKENRINKPILLPKKEEECKQLKRVSQIDKFNMRYGKK